MFLAQTMPAALTHISQDPLPLDRDHGQALKPKVRLIPKLEGCVSLPDVQQVLYANAKCIILIVAWLIADNHAGHERLGDPQPAVISPSKPGNMAYHHCMHVHVPVPVHVHGDVHVCVHVYAWACSCADQCVHVHAQHAAVHINVCNCMASH